MNQVINLFRADSLGNKTLPEEFWKSGLWTKQINGGDSLALEKYGWIRNIKSHIRPKQKLEKRLYHTTSMLSFTTNENRALKYLRGRDLNNYESTQLLNEANAFIFEMTINKSDLERVEKGVYQFNYYCNLKRDLNLAQQLPILEALPLSLISCPICNKNESRPHTLRLIDSVEYLTEKTQYDPSLKKALEFAQRDEEWLVMSMDPFEVGRTSNVPPANFWSWKLYKYV